MAMQNPLTVINNDQVFDKTLRTGFHPLRQINNTHDTSDRQPIALNANTTTVNGSSINHRQPRAALHNDQGIIRTQSIASNSPAGLARAAATNSPRTKWEKLVVIPQPGHGRENIKRIWHSGSSKNCWCVPNPRGSGFRVRATTNPLSRNTAQASNSARVVPPMGAPSVCRNRIMNRIRERSG